MIDWQTPPDEDAQKQAEAIEQLGREGVDGIAVSCTDANTSPPRSTRPLQLGAVVMCFDSDAPRSKRLCYYGTDDIDLRQAGDGGTGPRDGRQGHDRDPGRQPDRPEPAEPRRGRARKNWPSTRT